MTEIESVRPENAGESTRRIDRADVPEGLSGPPVGYENTPPELWPDETGKPPELTPALMRVLRGKYFTVRHVTGACGHKQDTINQPKNNCDDCWAVFFNTHPQLVEVAHDFYQKQGRGPMVGMRGEKFVKKFEQYMALLYRAMLERKKAEELNRGTDSQERSGGSVDNGTDTVSEAPAVS